MLRGSFSIYVFLALSQLCFTSSNHISEIKNTNNKLKLTASDDDNDEFVDMSTVGNKISTLSLSMLSKKETQAPNENEMLQTHTEGMLLANLRIRKEDMND